MIHVEAPITEDTLADATVAVYANGQTTLYLTGGLVLTTRWGRTRLSPSQVAGWLRELADAIDTQAAELANAPCHPWDATEEAVLDAQGLGF